MKRKQTSADQIYETLRHRIITCEYGYEVMLNEMELATEFGVSRTPVREALHRLEGNHFISLTKAGAQLLPMDILHLRDAYESKNVLLTGIAVLACERISAQKCRELKALLDQPTRQMDNQAFLDWYDAVHHLINSATRNQMFQTIMDNTFDNLFRFLAYCVINEFCDRAAIEDSLKELGQAIIDRDKQRAMVCAGRHTDASLTVHPATEVTDGVEKEWEKQMCR